MLTLKCPVFGIGFAGLGSKSFAFCTHLSVSYERDIQIAELLARSQYELGRSCDRENPSASCVVLPFPRVNAELLSRIPFQLHDSYAPFPTINLQSFRQKRPSKRDQNFGITLASKVKIFPNPQPLSTPLPHSPKFQLNNLLPFLLSKTSSFE
jgi:hypothetical protein